MDSIACQRPADIPQVPVYTISLDVPVEKRWAHVMEDYKVHDQSLLFAYHLMNAQDKFISVIEDIDSLLKNDLGLSSLVEKAITGTMAGITHLGLMYLL